ncbi:hypothetical protein LG326_12515 [Metaplanococcus flavidus]
MNTSIKNKRIKNTVIVFLLSLGYISALFTYFEGAFTYGASLIVLISIVLLFKEKEFYLFTPLFIFFYSQLIIPGDISVFRIYTVLFFIKIAMQTKVSLNKSLAVPLVLIIFYALLVIAFYNFRFALMTIVDTSFIVLYISVFLKGKANFNTFFKFYAYAAVLSIAYGALKLGGQITTSVYLNGAWVEISRFLGTFGDPNYFGFFTNIAIFSVLILTNMNKVKRILILIILYAALIASVSITAILCNGMGLLLYFLLMKGFGKKMVILFASFLSVFFLYQLSLSGKLPILSNALIRIESMKLGVNDGAFSNLTSNRTTIWKDHLNYFADQPNFNILFGGNFITDGGFNETLFSMVSHQVFIDMLLNFGLMGTLIFICFILFKINSHFRGYYKVKHEHFLLLILIKFIWLFYAFGLSMFPSWTFLLFFFL